MIKYIHNLPQHKAWPVIKFILQSLFYFMIIIALLYLFNYSGKGQGHFIYNEFYSQGKKITYARFRLYRNT